VCEQTQQEPRQPGVRRRVALLAALDAVLWVAAQQAGSDARVLERQQAREQQQAPQASMQLRPVPLWAPPAAHQMHRGPAQHLESLEPLLVQREPPDELLADGPQAQHRGRALQVSPELASPHAAWGAAALP